MPIDALTTFKAGAAVERFFREKQQKAVDDHHQACIRELAEAANAIAVALVAAGCGQDPLSPAVQVLLEDELGTPRFTARAHRLFKEMLSSPSKHRRRRLAAVLMGGPAALTSPDELDRMDILVAQLLDDNVLLLDDFKKAFDTTHVPSDGASHQEFFLADDGRFFCRRAGGFREIAAGVGRLAFETLVSSGCINSRRKLNFELDSLKGYLIELSAVGRFFLETLAKEPIASALR